MVGIRRLFFDEAADEERHERVRLGLRPADRILRRDDAVLRRVARVLEHDARPEARIVERRPVRSSSRCPVTSGTADVVGPFETESVTVEPREPSDPPDGSCRVTSPAARSESTSIRETSKPAERSSAAAWSYGAPTTLGTVTGLGPLDTLIRTCVPSTTTVPALGDWAVTEPSSRSELTSTTWATSPARVSSATASSLVCPTTLGIGDLGLAGRDVDADDLALVDPRALGRELGEDEALLDVRVRNAPHLRDEPLVLDQRFGLSLLDADDIRNRDGAGALEAVGDRLVQEPGRDEQREQRAERDEPGPERP